MSSNSDVLVLVQSADQFRALSESGIDLSGAQIVGLSSSLSLGRQARASGLTFHPFADYIGSAEFGTVMREADRLSRTWFAELVGISAPPDLLESVRLEILQGFSEILLAQRVVSRVLTEFRPARTLLAPGMDPKIAGVVAFEAGLRGMALPVQGAEPGTGCGVQGIRRTRTAAAKVLTLLRQSAHNARLLASLRWAQHSRRLPVVLAFGAGVDAVNLRRLMPALQSAGEVRPVLARAGGVDPAMHNRPGQADFPILHFLPLNSMLRTRSETGQSRRWLDAFAAGQARYGGAHPYLFANPHLRPFFERLFIHLLPHAQATRLDARDLLRWLRPAVLLTANEVSFPVRALVLEARRLGVPTLGLIHSGLNNLLYRDFSSDRLMVWGRVHVRDFVRVLNKDEGRLVPIGNPQYDSWGKGSNDRLSKRDSESRRLPRVLVVTAVPQWHMYYIDQRQHLRAWLELAGLARFRVDLVVKPHPRFDDYAFYDSLRADSPTAGSRDGAANGGVTVMRGAYLEDLLPDCDLVVVPGFPTTAAVEAMLSGKPVVYLRCGFDEVEFCTSIADGCLVVTEPDAVVPTILEVLRDTEKRAELVRKGQAFLDEFLGPRDGGASRRMATAIADAATQKRSRSARARESEVRP